MKIHIVQKGDTLWKIAKKYGVDFEQLKSMNTQLSNPDLIMPGMKIKVPSGNIAVKKEGPINKEAPIKKEMPKAEHPFAKEKPKAVIGVEDTAPKEPVKEKPSKPYIPPVPNVKHPVYSGLDVNNYYTVNMAMMPQMANPQLPPKPENVLPDITKDEKDAYKEPAKEMPYYVSPQQKEEGTKDMANMPNVPNISNIPNMEMPEQSGPNMPNMQMPAYTGPNMPNMQMPAYTEPNMPNMQMPAYTGPSMPNMQMPVYTAPAMHYPQYCPPQYMVPVSPILPGSGLCPPGPYPPMMMPYGYGPAMPNQPYPTALSPAEYDDDDMAHANMPYPQAVAPAHYSPCFPINPYAGVPVSPVLPGYGFNPNQVLGAYGEAPDDDYENGSHEPNMPYQQAVAPAYEQSDCGCGGASPYQGYPNYGYPMQQSFSGYPVQQPYMAQQGYNNQGQMAPNGNMFGMPNYEDREADED